MIKKEAAIVVGMLATIAVIFMITRNINNVEIEVEERLADELYFDEDFINSIDGSDGDISAIKDGIYKNNKNTSYFPLSIMWELTNRCNFRCPFCYINTEKAIRKPYHSFEKIKSIIDELVDMGMLFCTISGGECILHPDFKKIYLYLKKCGVLVSVFTNAYLINEEVLDLFSEFKPYKVEVSIYGMDEDTFFNTTGQHGFEIVLDNVLKLKKRDINVRCKSPITSFTSSSIVSIKNWCIDNNIQFYFSDELFDSYYGESSAKYKVDDDIYKEAVKNRVNSIIKNSNHIYGRKKAWDCTAGKYSGVLAADGFFYPCMSCVGREKYKISIDEGIKKAIDIRRKIIDKEKNKILDFCSGCNMCNVCDKCIVSMDVDGIEKIETNCQFMKSISKSRIVQDKDVK